MARSCMYDLCIYELFAARNSLPLEIRSQKNPTRTLKRNGNLQTVKNDTEYTSMVENEIALVENEETKETTL